MLRELSTRIAFRLRPELKELQGVLQTADIINTVLTLYTLPLAAIGIAGLIWFADFSLLRAEWPLFLLLVAVTAAFFRLNFTLEVELQPGILGAVSGSLTSVVNWAGLLLLGPLGAWPGLLVIGFDSVRRALQARHPGERWVQAGNINLNVISASLFAIVCFGLYRGLGGEPAPAALWPNFLPSLVGIAAGAVLPLLLLSPLLWLMHTVPELEGAERSFLSSIGLSTLFSTLPAPFGLLGAVLYAQHGIGALLFFLLGAALAAGLTHRLSQAVIRARQRSRELAELERLGRAILDAPPTLDALPPLLAPALTAIFPGTGAAGIAWRWGRDGAAETWFSHPPEVAFRHLNGARDALRGEDPPAHAFFDEALDGQQRQGVALPVGEQGELGGLYVRLNGGDLTPYVPALQSLAAQIAGAETRMRNHAQALANERMAQELAVAGRIQASFLPAAVPQPAGWDLHALLEPARETSGDFYDFIPLGERRLGLIVADVADKGTGAALYMALSRTLLRTYAVSHPDDPAAVLAAASERILADTQAEQFVTVFFGVLELDTGRLTYASAGHNPVFLLHPENDTQSLGRSGPPVGVLPGLSWRSETAHVPPGGLLALYTDGVTEAQDGEHAEYGEERLLQMLNRHGGATAAEIAGAISRDVAAFVDGAPQFDDITLLVVRRK